MERYHITTKITNTDITIEFEDWGHGVFTNPSIYVDTRLRQDLDLIEKILDTIELINDDSTEDQRGEVLKFLQDIEPQDIQELERFVIDAYNTKVLENN